MRSGAAAACRVAQEHRHTGQENWPDWARLLSDHGVDTSELTDRIAALDWKTVLEKALTGAGALIDSVVDLAGTTVSAVANVTFAIVIMFYVLLDRRSLAKQSRRLSTPT